MPKQPKSPFKRDTRAQKRMNPAQATKMDDKMGIVRPKKRGK